MTIVGFNFTKMLVERKKSSNGKVNIANNVNLMDVEKANMDFGAKKSALKFSFEFTTHYEPDIASMEFRGDLLFLTTEDEGKKIIDNWVASKKIPSNIMVLVHNAVLAKCSVEAVMLSRDMNLPAPIRLPRVDSKQDAAVKKKE